MFKTKKDIIFLNLAGFFIANALLGELIGSKLIYLNGFTLSMGIIPWPLVFVLTDVINDYFGKEGVRKLTFISVGLIIYAFIILYIAMNIPASPISSVNDEQFNAVFGQSLWIIVGSITAFLVSQLIDVIVFWIIKRKTGDKKIWLRATGSTIVSQFIDTYIVTGIAFWLPGKLTFSQFFTISTNGYLFKIFLAILLTPLIYLLHFIVKKFINQSS